MNRLVFFLVFTIFAYQTSLANQISNLDDNFLPPQFSATYDVHKNGLRVGKMVVNLKFKEDELIYSSNTKPVGLAALFLGGQQFTDFALLRKFNDSYRAIKFKHEMKGSDKNRNEYYNFDWATNKLTGVYRDHVISMDIPPGTFDSFSSQLLLMRKPLDNVDTYSFSVISKGRLKDYVYTFEGSQKLETKLGTMDAHKYVRRKDNEKKTNYIGWYAESLNFIPVRLDKIENGNIDISIKITKIEWL